jgi:hypothetical protein
VQVVPVCICVTAHCLLNKLDKCDHDDDDSIHLQMAMVSQSRKQCQQSQSQNLKIYIHCNPTQCPDLTFQIWQSYQDIIMYKTIKPTGLKTTVIKYNM